MLHISNNTNMKKSVELDENADEELRSFSPAVQAKFAALFGVLEKEGFLKEPYAKRVNKNLFEIRIKHEGQWRALYA